MAMNCKANTALNLAPFGRWTLRDKAAKRRLALLQAHAHPHEVKKPFRVGFIETRLSSVQTIQPTHTKPAIDRENKVWTAKVQPVFTAAYVDADPDQSKDARGGFIRLRRQQLIAPHAPAASGINTVQGRNALGEIDAEKDHGHGHLLASVGSGLRLSNPIVDPARRQRMRKNLGWLAGRLGDVSFIR